MADLSQCERISKFFYLSALGTLWCVLDDRVYLYRSGQWEVVHA